MARVLAVKPSNVIVGGNQSARQVTASFSFICIFCRSIRSQIQMLVLKMEFVVKMYTEVKNGGYGKLSAIIRSDRSV